MSEGVGNINYGSRSGAASGFINVAGARNGLSVDADNFIVLGNDEFDASIPARLSSNRYVPLGISQITFASGPSEGDGAFVRIGGLSGGTVIGIGINGVDGWHYIMNAPSAGTIAYSDVRNGGVITQLWAPTFYNNVPLIDPQTCAYQINSRWQPSDLVSTNFIRDFEVLSNINMNVDLGLEYASVHLRPRLTAAVGSNIVRGVYYHPIQTTALPNQVAAWENTIGDVYLGSLTTGNNLGRVSVRRGAYPAGAPTAFIHIGASAGTAGTAPLKIDAGTLLGTPENGAMEYDGTNLYFTVGATRKIVTLI